MKPQTITLDYSFRLQNGEEKKFCIQLEAPAMQLVRPKAETPPDWARLSFHQCPNCPLHPATHPYCPIAANLVDVIEAFKDGVSYEEADITISGANREYHKLTSLQHGVSALMGLHMVTSGCPVMDKLRPMVYTHLPFATIEETMYRSLSMYLLAQYFLWKKGKSPDWELKKLVSIYDEVSKVNRAFRERILNMDSKDANVNALASLDCFATLTVMSIADNYLEEIEGLFHAYLQEPRAAE